MCSSYSQVTDCDSRTEKLEYIASKLNKLPLESSSVSVDSLMALISQGTCPIGEMNGYIAQGRIAREYGKLDTADFYLNQGLEIAINQQEIIRQKDIYSHLALTQRDRGELAESETIFNKGLEIPCPEGDEKCFKTDIKLLINKGVIMEDQSEYHRSLTFYQQADSLIDSHGIKDSIYKVSLYNTMGNIYDRLELKDESIECYLVALKYMPHKHSARFSIFNNIGHRYKDKMVYDSAKYYYQRSITETDKVRFHITPYQGLAEIAEEQGDYPSAIDYLEQAVKNAQIAQKDNFLNTSSALLGKVHYLNGDYQIAQKLLTESHKKLKDSGFKIEDINQIEKFLLLNELKIKQPQVHDRFNDFLTGYDSITHNLRTAAIATAVAAYDKKIVQDSLRSLILQDENKGLKLHNARLIIITFI